MLEQQRLFEIAVGLPEMREVDVKARQLIRRLNIGATVGRPNDVATQTETLGRMLALIDSAEAFGAVDQDA